MSEEYEPGRPGFRGRARGPALTTIPHVIEVQERWTERWSRLWALSHDGSIVPNDLTGGWWLMAEFATRREAREYFGQLLHVFGGGTTLEAHRRRATERARPAPGPRCPNCGGDVLRESDLTFDGARSLGCDACGFVGPRVEFTAPA